MTSTSSKSALVAACIGLLTACGGGGGGASSGPATANGGDVTPGTNPVTKFSEISVPAGFSWATVQSAQGVTVTVTTSSRPTLGESRVVVSNFIDKDPTGSGESIPPMSTDVIATALASNAAGPSATASFGTLRLPAGTMHVMVEVFDMSTGARLSSAKVTVASLMASGLRIDA